MQDGGSDEDEDEDQDDGDEPDPLPSGESLLLDTIAGMCKRSSALGRRFFLSGVALYAVHLLATHAGDDAAVPMEVAAPAARVLCTLVLDRSHGMAVKEVVCDMLTPSFSLQTAFERKPEAFVRYFLRDHRDESSGRRWNGEARERLQQFLATEISNLEQAVKRAGVDSWDGRSPRWDSARLRQLHATPIDVAVLREGAAGD